MTISELILMLKEIEKDHGDISVKSADMSEKTEDYPLSGVILKLRTEIEVLKNCQPTDYHERIKFKQVILKYLMELQKYREQEEEEPRK